MKGNKKVLAVALLLLLVAVSFGTYAIYKTVATSSSTVEAAAWSIEVNDTGVVTGEHTFSFGTINWTCPTGHVASGVIAPGCTGTVDLEIDATGTEVSLDYLVTIGSVTVNNAAVPNGTITVSSSGSLSGSILLSDETKTRTIPLTITWAGNANDGDEKNAADVGLQDSTITLGLTVTATQKLSS